MRPFKGFVKIFAISLWILNPTNAGLFLPISLWGACHFHSIPHENIRKPGLLMFSGSIERGK